MADLFKCRQGHTARALVSAHMLGRRVGGQKFGMRNFQGHEFLI